MKRRKKNAYFDWKSLQWKRGLSKAAKERKRAELAQEKRYEKLQRAAEKKAERAERVAEKKKQGALFKQLQRDAKPQRAKRHKMSPADEQAWQELLRSNPQKARELVRQATMAKKKRSKKRKRNSRKGVMPAGLKAYWAKKRRAKAKRKNPKKRRTRKVKRTRVRRRKPVSMRVRNYRRPRRRRKANPRRKRSVKIIKTNLRKGTKAFRQFVAAQRAKYGTARVL